MDSGGFDLGVISFATVMISSSYWLGIMTMTARAGAAGGGPATTKCIRNLTTGTHVFVAVNYLLGSYVGFAVLSRPGFGIYCIIFTLLWGGIAYFGFHLMTKSGLVAGPPGSGEILPLSS